MMSVVHIQRQWVSFAITAYTCTNVLEKAIIKFIKFYFTPIPFQKKKKEKKPPKYQRKLNMTVASN